MAPAHKLLEPLGGRSMLGTTLVRLGASAIDGVVVVVGHEAGLVGAEAALALEGVAIVEAERFADGLSATLAAGIAAVPDDAEGVLVVLGDMPLVRTGTTDLLLAAFRASGAAAPIVVPTHDGRRGNPVLWHRAHLPALAALDGDGGGRSLLAARADDVVTVATDDGGVLADIDTPGALEAARAVIGGGR
jgi:molybdenum cofactor cytidylyltransferase